MTTSPLTLAVTISSGPDAVWRALTTPEELVAWWTEGVKLEPRVGGAFVEPWVDGKGQAQLATGVVEVVEPGRRIEFSWREKFWAQGETSRVAISISGNENLTRLELVHSGWQTFQKDKVVTYRKGFATGWWSLLASLMAHCSAHSITNDILETVALDCSVDQVFEAWVNPQLLAKWLCTSAKAGGRPGDSYELYWNPRDPTSNSTLGCQVLFADHGKSLVFQWRGPDHLPLMSQPGSTIGRVTILPKDRGTQVMLQHTGFGLTPAWEEARAWQRRAWEMALGELVTLTHGMAHG